MNAKYVAVVAAATVTAALTGCTHVDAGSTDLSLTAVETHTQWVGAGDRHWRSDLTGQVIATSAPAGTLRSGSPLLQPRSDDPTKAALCTAGAWFTDTSNQPVLLTAGHCDRTPNAGVALSPHPGATRDELIPVGTYVTTYPDGAPIVEDIAVFQPDPGVAPSGDSAMVAGKWPARGVLSAAGAGDLPPGASVCVVGVEPGVRCGSLMTATESAAMVDLPDISLRGGDSGAAAWLVDDTGGAVLLGGVTGGSVSGVGTVLTVDLADPVVRGFGLNLVEGER